MKQVVALKFLLVTFLSATSSFAWQDDANIFLLDPMSRFSTEKTWEFLPSARSELRVGKYLGGDTYHSWRGGVLGDVVFLSFGPNLLWHWSLGMETLADANNDIHFRLVQVYYESITGILWRLGPGALSLAYGHRCSHGADGAVVGRILIRSGLKSKYELPLSYKAVRFLLAASSDAYFVGQNLDLQNQPRAQAQLSASALWPLKGAWSMIVASSFGEELIVAGKDWVYSIGAPAADWRLRPLWGARVGLRVESLAVKSDFSFSFSHIPDTGIGLKAQSHHGLSLDLNLYW